jgi:chaperonin GroES
MIIKPLPGYVCVEPFKEQNKTASGLYMAENEKKPGKGTIIAVGLDIEKEGSLVKCPVKVGDVVLTRKWGNEDVRVDVKDYQLVKFEDVLAILED